MSQAGHRELSSLLSCPGTSLRLPRRRPAQGLEGGWSSQKLQGGRQGVPTIWAVPTHLAKQIDSAGQGLPFLWQPKALVSFSVALK